jgi:hypothetical protein
MAANLLETVIVAAGSILGLPTQGNIGGITIDTTVEELYEDSLEVTEHPVELGALITDHSYKRPMEILLRCGWSDANSSAALDALASLTGTNSPTSQTGGFTGGAMAASDYIAGIYSQILQLQESRQTISVVAGLRSYDSMLITRCTVRRDQRTQTTLLLEAHCRQVILVSTSSATLPPQANQATPANTAETMNTGTQQTQPGSPAPGGSNPPNVWEGFDMATPR